MVHQCIGRYGLIILGMNEFIYCYNVYFIDLELSTLCTVQYCIQYIFDNDMVWVCILRLALIGMGNALIWGTSSHMNLRNDSTNKTKSSPFNLGKKSSNIESNKEIVKKSVNVDLNVNNYNDKEKEISMTPAPPITPVTIQQIHTKLPNILQVSSESDAIEVND